MSAKRAAPGASSESLDRKRAKAKVAELRVEPSLGRVPRYTSRKPAAKLADTRTGFKKKNSLRENCAIAKANVESGRWTVSNLHNSVNALYGVSFLVI